jgi:hypothetical protein
LNIEVNVIDVDLNTVLVPGYEDSAPTTLADKVVDQLVREALKEDGWKPLVRRVQEIRDEEIRKLVLPAITEAFEKPVQKTNTWGEPTGEPLTLREVVVEEARKILNGTKSDSFRGDEPLGRQLINQMVLKELRAELTDAIKTEREKVVTAVREQAAQLITEAVTKGVTGR